LNVLLLLVGGCSNLELGVIVKDAIENLEHRALHVKRIMCGEMMTSFNMKGFSLTVLKLTEPHLTSFLNLLDAPTEAFAWPKMISTVQLLSSIQSVSDSLEFNEEYSARFPVK
jgi:dihydroxyacetone kinase